MKFLKEYVRRHSDNQVVIRVPSGTEVVCTESIGTIKVDCYPNPVTKNLDSWFYLSRAEAEEYLGYRND